MTGALSSRKNPIDISFSVAPHRRHDHRVDHDRALRHAEHMGDRVAVDVGVEHADACSPRAANAAARFAVSVDLPTPPLPEAIASTRVVGRSEIVFSGPPATQPGREGRLLVGAHHVEVEPHRGDALDGADEPLHLILERGAHRAAGDGERDRDLDPPSSSTHDVSHHVELGHGLVELGIDHRLERPQDRVAVGKHRGASVPTAP